MFRLNYLMINSHPQLGNIEIIFTQDEIKSTTSKPFTTVIIGPNGTGKSYILRIVSEVFRFISNYKAGEKEYLPYDFHIKYNLGQNNYDVISKYSPLVPNKGIRRKMIFLLKDYPKGEKIFGKVMKMPFGHKISEKRFEIKISELELPSKILVSSIMLNDRFVFANSRPHDFYQYLGVRRTAGTTSTKTFERKSISFLFDAIEMKDFKSDLSEMLAFIGYGRFLKIRYKTRYSKLFFSGELSSGEFTKFYERWWESSFAKRNKDNPPWGKWYYDILNKEPGSRITNIIEFLNNKPNRSKYLKKKPRSMSYSFEVDLFEGNMIEDLYLIQELDKLDILEIEGIQIQKQQTKEKTEQHTKQQAKQLSIDQASSGEYHLILSLLGLYAKISQNSLVLIDEPEISLHPNWQMQYIQFVKKIYRKFSSCHFIFATHSHFLISDLEEESSSIVGLKREDSIKATLFDKSTFGWSADEVLYKIFNVKTVRNYFIERDLTELLGLIGQNSQDINRLKLLQDNLSKLSITSDDPLKEIMTEVDTYIQNNDSKN